MTLTKKALNEIKKESGNKLEKHVINTLLDKGTAEEIKGYIEDLLSHGCVSGMEGSLIYYTDTTKFYNKYNDEINELLYEMLSETGYKSPAELFGDKWEDEDPLAKEDLNQNLLAWFGFEETVKKVAYQLDMDI